MRRRPLKSFILKVPPKNMIWATTESDDFIVSIFCYCFQDLIQDKKKSDKNNRLQIESITEANEKKMTDQGMCVMCELELLSMTE